MLTFSYEHNPDFFKSNILSEYLTGQNVAVFDIETLGLNPAFCRLVLIGLVKVYPDGHSQTMQFFSETPSDEAEVLLALSKELEDCDYLLTYNGKHFDIPFVLRRAKQCHLKLPPLPYNLDLYQFLRGHSQLGKILPNLKQKTVEEYMGVAISRDDEISGGESVELYKSYASCVDPAEKDSLMQKILLHNHDDILQLYKIFPLVTKTDVHKAFFALGFNVSGLNGWPQLAVREISIASGSLTIRGSYLPERSDGAVGVGAVGVGAVGVGRYFSYVGYKSFELPYECSFDGDGSFSFAVPLEKKGSAVFANAFSIIGGKANLDYLERLAGYVNGFVVLREKGEYNHKEINYLSMAILRDFMERFDVPA